MRQPQDDDATNVLCIMADEHTRRALGAMGAQGVRTPNLDALAGRGTIFTSAYSSSPICVPARASFATGRPVHQLGCWDNHAPYDGSQADSWGHRLGAAGRRVVTVGKLHYRSAEAPTGFPEQLLPMHVAASGGLRGLLRGEMPPVPQMRKHIDEAGAGETEYTRYDRDVAEAAATWLREEAVAEDRPWALFVSFVSPHFPLICPEEFLDATDPARLVPPTDWDADPGSQHPAVQLIRRLQCQEEPLALEQVMAAVRAYYGLVAFVDAQVGRVLDALEATGQAARTRIMYTSDHGEMLGEHGLWWKSSMYRGSVGVPLIVAGPGIPAGRTNDTPVSSLDAYPTFLDWSGVAPGDADADLPGRSLMSFVHQPAPERLALSEYHGVFSRAGMYMVTPVEGRYTYVHHIGEAPQLFDVIDDPDELHDLADDPRHRHAAEEGLRLLRRFVDPDEVDRQARASQGRRLDRAGGRAAVLAAAGSFTHTPAPGGDDERDA